MSEQNKSTDVEAIFRYYLGDDLVDALKELGIINDSRPLTDPRTLSHRPAGDPDHEFSDLVYRLAEQQGVELPGFYRDLIGEQAKRMRFLRPVLMKSSNRKYEAREIASIMQLQEAAIGQLLDYVAMMAIDESTGAMKPEEFTRQMSGWIKEIMTKRELPGLVAEGRLGTGVYTEDDAVLTLARIQSPEMTRRFTALASPSKMTQVEFLQAAELHQPFKAVVPFLHQEGDPNGFMFATQGYDLMGVDHAYRQVMAEIEIDPVLGTRPAVTAVHVPWSNTVRTAMYVSRGEPFWVPEEMPLRLLNMWRRILIWTFEFYSVPDLVDFLRCVYQHNADVFARVTRQMDLRMIRPADIVRILGPQSPEQTLTEGQFIGLDEFSRYVFHLQHATMRRPRAEIVEHLGRTTTATSRREFEELACIDEAAMAVYLGLPQTDPTGVFDFFTERQKLMINHSISVCDAMVQTMVDLETEIQARAVEAKRVDFTFVKLSEPPPALPAGIVDHYEEGEPFRDDAPPDLDEEIAMMSMPSSFDKSDSNGSSECSSDPSGGEAGGDESDEFRPLTTSDLPSEQTVDASDPNAKPPVRPRFKGKVPQVPLSASMQAIEDGISVPEPCTEAEPELEGDTTEERPSRAPEDEEDESSVGDSAPPIHLDTVDEAIDTPPPTRDISGLSHREVPAPVEIDPTPPPITDVADPIDEGSMVEDTTLGTPSQEQRIALVPSDEQSYHDPDGSLEIEGAPDTCEQSMIPDESEEMVVATTEPMPAYGQNAMGMEAYTESDSGSLEESSSLGSNPPSEESSSKRSRSFGGDEPSSNSGPAKT